MEPQIKHTCSINTPFIKHHLFIPAMFLYEISVYISFFFLSDYLYVFSFYFSHDAMYLY